MLYAPGGPRTVDGRKDSDEGNSDGGAQHRGSRATRRSHHRYGEGSRPRHCRTTSSDFQSLVDDVYGLLAGETKAEHEELGTAPGEPGITRAIPNVTVNELAGFLEHLAGLRGEQRVDISGVADELHMDSDQALRLAEAAERLGFVVLDHGNIIETPLGETFAMIERRQLPGVTRIGRRVLVRRRRSARLAAPENHAIAGKVGNAMSVTVRPYRQGGWMVDVLTRLIDGSKYRERRRLSSRIEVRRTTVGRRSRATRAAIRPTTTTQGGTHT